MSPRMRNFHLVIVTSEVKFAKIFNLFSTLKIPRLSGTIGKDSDCQVPGFSETAPRAVTRKMRISWANVRSQ